VHARFAVIPNQGVPTDSSLPEQKASDSDSNSETAKLSPTESLTKLVGPFVSSLGVLGVILYVSGYLISTAQLHLLGLGAVMSYSHDYYVQQGGRFLADLGATLTIIAIPFSAIALMIYFAVPALRWVDEHVIHRQPRRDKGRLLSRAKKAAPALAYFGLLLCLALWTDDPQTYGAPLTASNLLFVGGPASAPSAKPSSELQPTVADLLFADDEEKLSAIFEGKLAVWAWVVVLSVIAYFVTYEWNWRRLALAPFVMLLFIYSLWLPMLYGVLKVPIRFPEITFREKGSPTESLEPPLFLLNKGDKDLLLFSVAQRKALLYEQSDVRELAIGANTAILKKLRATGK